MSLEPPSHRVAFVLGVFSGSHRVRNFAFERGALALSLCGADFQRSDSLDLREDHSLGLRGRGAGLHADGGGGSDGGESLGVCPASWSWHRL